MAEVLASWPKLCSPGHAMVLLWPCPISGPRLLKGPWGGSLALRRSRFMPPSNCSRYSPAGLKVYGLLSRFSQHWMTFSEKGDWLEMSSVDCSQTCHFCKGLYVGALADQDTQSLSSEWFRGNCKGVSTFSFIFSQESIIYLKIHQHRCDPELIFLY